METLLNAASSTAGALLAGGRFRVPPFQREYAWEAEEVDEFFGDLSKALHDETYFLGLVILTGTGQPKDVVDGQQRLLTLTMLASALFHKAMQYERRALAERLKSTFLKSIDFDSDEELPRVTLSSDADSAALQRILEAPASALSPNLSDGQSVSTALVSAYQLLTERLDADLEHDPFRRLGQWADFLTNKLYFASFVHPDPASAYRVFEVVNTRGKELTTADLLKSYVLNQTPDALRDQRYEQWQALASAFREESTGTFVQFIRHAVTTQRGHVPPKDLYDVLAGSGGREHTNIPPANLMSLLEGSLPAYQQMIDPTAVGPASEEQVAVFSVLNSLNVLSVRPILLAMVGLPDATAGMRELLRLVVHRVVVGNLGTGNVERRFGQAAKRITDDDSWKPSLRALDDLDRDRGDFRQQLHRRSMNKDLLAVLRRSVIQQTITPQPDGHLFLIKPRGAEWSTADEDRAPYWASTIGNSYLAQEDRRPMSSSTWSGFKTELLPLGVEGEWRKRLASYEVWDIESISELGEELADLATEIWYASD